MFGKLLLRHKQQLMFQSIVSKKSSVIGHLHFRISGEMPAAIYTSPSPPVCSQHQTADVQCPDS
jgi:hypothetical protein